jgi:protein SCO1/2
VLTVTGCGSSSDQTFSGTKVSPPFDVLQTPLELTDGTKIPITSLDKPMTLVFFGYTHCPDVCPTVLASLASGLKQLSDSIRDQVDVVFITTDPARDSPKRLDSYLGQFDPTFTGMTGKLKDIAAVGKSVGIYVDQGDVLPDGGVDPNSHGTYIVAVDGRHDEAPVFWRGDTSPHEFASDITYLLTHDS